VIFALLFILAFLLGLGIYHFKRQWLYAVLVPVGLFSLSVVLDSGARDAWLFSVFFGLPIVFFGALLGAYIYQIRFIDLIEEELSELDSSESELN